MPSYTNTKRKRVKKSREASLKQRLAKWLVLALVTIGSLVAVWKLIMNPGGNEVSQEELYPYGIPSALTDQDTFRIAYQAANFTEEAEEATNSVHVSGRIESTEQNQEFSLVRKLPQSMRLTFKTSNYEMTIGVHEGRVWQRIRMPQREDVLNILEGPEATKWREQAAFFDRIARTFKGEGCILKIEPTTHEYKDYLRVDISSTGYSPPVKVWIDPHTMHPSFQQEELPDGTMQETKFSDYRRMHGIAIPFKSESSTDGVFASRIVIESFSINSGILTSAFEIPEK